MNKIKTIPKDGGEKLIIYRSHSTNVVRLVIEGEKQSGRGIEFTVSELVESIVEPFKSLTNLRIINVRVNKLAVMLGLPEGVEGTCRRLLLLLLFIPCDLPAC
jgi:hypothetical protein